MVTYDWRRCPAPLLEPAGPTNYGPLAADVGARNAGLPLNASWEPTQSIIGSTAHGCPPDYMAWASAAVLGYVAAAAGAFGKSVKKAVT